MQPTLIFCADGNRKHAEIAIAHGLRYGAQLPNTIYFPPVFVDQDWLHPNRDKYMDALAIHRPALASVLDWERDEQLPEVLEWAALAAEFVSEAVIIIPKVPGGIERLPRTINGKPIRLGYSTPVKTPGKFSGTGVPLREFAGWDCHILGGSPQKQYMVAHKGIRAASVDNNYIMGQANRGRFFAPDIGNAVKAQNRYFPQLAEAGLGHIREEIPYRAFSLSCANLKAMWSGSEVAIRYATGDDIPAIQQIARQYDSPKNKDYIGYVNLAAIREHAARYEVHVATFHGRIVGFVNWHLRRDGRATIYELAVDRAYRGIGAGRALVGAIPAPIQLKCTIDNPANGFYECIGFKLVGTEPGKRAALNVWRKESG